MTKAPAVSVFIAAACLAGSAAAQPIFEPRIAFRDNHNASTVPTIHSGAVIPFSSLTSPPSMDFAIMLGAFNAQGFTNEGLFSWSGSMTATGTGFTVSNLPGVRSPFSFSPVANGTVDGTSIVNIDAVRNPLLNIPWPQGQAEPPRPDWSQGRDEYFSVFRFRITLTDLQPGMITLNFSGLMTAAADFALLSGEQGENATWVAAPFVRDVPVSGSFSIFVPAPGAAALLTLAGLAAARRRRA